MLVSNKDRIFRAALRLFAEKGYEGVSMRDIAAEVGIKASSIYNHFPGKAAILDEAVAVFRAELEKRSMNKGWGDVDAALREAGPKELLADIMLAPLSLLEAPSLRDLVRVITRGQYHHEGIRAFLREEMFGRPLALLLRVLARYKELDLVEDFPADFLAAELQAVMTANFYRLSLHTDGLWADQAKTRAAMKLHIDFFWRAAEKKKA
jgi:AcrR family transcriptional regulator